jgi:predicted transcriptional regulator
MKDILETLVAVKTMDEADVKAKFGTSASNVQKILKALLLEEMVEEQQKESKSKYKKKTSDSSSGKPDLQKRDEQLKESEIKSK